MSNSSNAWRIITKEGADAEHHTFKVMDFIFLLLLEFYHLCFLIGFFLLLKSSGNKKLCGRQHLNSHGLQADLSL